MLYKKNNFIQIYLNITFRKKKKNRKKKKKKVNK